MIGRRQGVRFATVTTSALRLRVIEAEGEPEIHRLAAFFLE